MNQKDVSESVWDELPQGTLLPGLPAQHGWKQLPETDQRPGQGVPHRGREGPTTTANRRVGPWAGGLLTALTVSLRPHPSSQGREGSAQAQVPSREVCRVTLTDTQGGPQSRASPLLPRWGDQGSVMASRNGTELAPHATPELCPPCCLPTPRGVSLGQEKTPNPAGLAGTTLGPALQLQQWLSTPRPPTHSQARPGNGDTCALFPALPLTTWDQGKADHSLSPRFPFCKVMVILKSIQGLPSSTPTTPGAASRQKYLHRLKDTEQRCSKGGNGRLFLPGCYKRYWNGKCYIHLRDPTLMLEDETAHELRPFTVEDGIIFSLPMRALNTSWRRQQKNQPLGAGCLNGPHVGISGHGGNIYGGLNRAKSRGPGPLGRVSGSLPWATSSRKA